MLFLGGIVLFAAGARIGHFLLLGVLATPVLWHEIVSVQYRLARMVSFAEVLMWVCRLASAFSGKVQILVTFLGKNQQRHCNCISADCTSQRI
jgi:hypothetical protein